MAIKIEVHIGLSSKNDNGLAEPQRVEMEQARREHALKLAARLWPTGFSAFDSIGHWDGGREPALIVSRITSDADGTVEVGRARPAVAEWANELGQECILLSAYPLASAELVQPAVRTLSADVTL